MTLKKVTYTLSSSGGAGTYLSRNAWSPSMYRVAYDGSQYYYMITGVAPDPDTASGVVYKTADFTTYTQVDDTYNYALGVVKSIVQADDSRGVVAVTHDGVDLILTVDFTNFTTLTTNYVSRIKEVWADASSSITAYYILLVEKQGSDYYYAVYTYDVAGDTLSGTTTLQTTLNGFGLYGCWFDTATGYPKWVGPNSSDVLHYYEFDGATINDLGAFEINPTPGNYIYFKQGNTYIFINDDNSSTTTVYYYIDGAWQTMLTTTSKTTALSHETSLEGFPTINYLAIQDLDADSHYIVRWYKFFSTGGMVMLDVTDSAQTSPGNSAVIYPVAGYGNYFVTWRYKVYDSDDHVDDEFYIDGRVITETNLYDYETNVTYTINDYPSARTVTAASILSAQYCKSYNPSGTLVLQAVVIDPVDNGGKYQATLKSLASFDLERLISYNKKQQLNSASLLEMITDNCLYLWADNTSIVATTDLYDIDSQKKPMLDIGTELARVEGRFFYHSPSTFKVYFDDGTTDTGIDIIYKSQVISEYQYLPKTVVVSDVTVYGQFGSDGQRLKGRAFNDLGGDTIVISRPLLSNPQTVADNIIAEGSVSVKRVSLKTAGLDFIQYGRQVTHAYSPKSISSAQWYVLGTTLYTKSGETQVVISDVMYHGKDKIINNFNINTSENLVESLSVKLVSGGIKLKHLGVDGVTDYRTPVGLVGSNATDWTDVQAFSVKSAATWQSHDYAITFTANNANDEVYVALTSFTSDIDLWAGCEQADKEFTIEVRNAAGDTAYIGIKFTTGGKIDLYDYDGTAYTEAQSYLADTFYHIHVSLTGSTLKYWINNVLMATYTGASVSPIRVYVKGVTGTGTLHVDSIVIDNAFSNIRAGTVAAKGLYAPLIVTDEHAYGTDWEHNDSVPTKADVYDKIEASVGGGISNVVEDTSPQLGGALDTNGQPINFKTTDKAQFRDAAIYIQSGDDGHLDITADTSVDFNTPTLDITGQATAIKLKDNTEKALDITEAANSYLNFDTRDGAEVINILKASLVSSTNKVQFRDTAISISSATDGHLDIDADTSIDFNSPILDVTSQSNFVISLKDNASTAFQIKEGANVYFTVNTADSAGEKIVLGKVCDGVTPTTAAHLTTKAYVDGLIDDTAYSSAWDTVTTKAPSQNAVYDALVTTYGLDQGTKLRFVPLDNKDLAAFDWYAVCKTDEDNIVLDLVNGDEESKTGFDAVGESTTNNLASNLLPSTAKAVYLSLLLTSTSVNANSRVQVFRNGNTNYNYQSLCIRCPAANNYYSVLDGIVELNSGKIKIHFDVLAGTLSFYLSIRGYYL